MTKDLRSSPARSRVLLFVLLVGSLAANVTAQAVGLSFYISAAFGLIVVASGVALFASYRRDRRNPRG